MIIVNPNNRIKSDFATEELIAFEEEIKELFLEAKVASPVHLSRGNEEQLIAIFENIRPEDWVFSNHRSHYHALLKGIPKEWLKREILANRSIHINNRMYKFFTSAIVGGVLPIALGVAMTGQKVWVFVGDMAAETGIFHECVKYATSQNLPVSFVVEDNGFSVDTPTEKVWRYSYEREFPHQGAGKFVIF